MDPVISRGVVLDTPLPAGLVGRRCTCSRPPSRSSRCRFDGSVRRRIRPLLSAAKLCRAPTQSLHTQQTAHQQHVACRLVRRAVVRSSAACRPVRVEVVCGSHRASSIALIPLRSRRWTPPPSSTPRAKSTPCRRTCPSCIRAGRSCSHHAWAARFRSSRRAHRQERVGGDEHRAPACLLPVPVAAVRFLLLPLSSLPSLPSDCGRLDAIHSAREESGDNSNIHKPCSSVPRQREREAEGRRRWREVSGRSNPNRDVE